MKIERKKQTKKKQTNKQKQNTNQKTNKQIEKVRFTNNNIICVLLEDDMEKFLTCVNCSYPT